MIEDGRAIWVVTCPFSSKTDRLVTQQSCALDYAEVARTISVAVGWTRGSPKRDEIESFTRRDVVPAEA